MAVKMFASITIGSSETEMKIFELSQRRGMKEIDHIHTRLELGRDAYMNKRIGTKNTEKLCETLKDFKQIMQGYRITQYRVCATSAFRESKNKIVFLDYIEKQTGLTIDVLSNSEQRFLDYKSIASVTAEFENIIKSPTAIVDIGGSSIQISLFDKDKLITTQNIRIGNVTTRERLASHEKKREHFEFLARELLEHEMEGFHRLYQKDRQIQNLIVVGGNLPELMKKYQKENKRIPSVARTQFLEVYQKIVLMRPDEISQMFDLSPELTSVMVPSAIYCKYLMDNFGVETIWLPGFSLSDGIAYDYAQKEQYLKITHSFEEDIIAAARNISKRYKCSQSHVKNMEQIGLQVFDRIGRAHGLTQRDRLLLQIAIILHNCGKFISLAEVSECAYHIIMATEIIGLSHRERELIANIVKYNTIALPDYENLIWQGDLTPEEYLRIAKLTAILRLVNSLDCTHKQKCTQVQVTFKKNELKITAETEEDVTLEMVSFEEKAEFFEQIFQIQPVFKKKKTG